MTHNDDMDECDRPPVGWVCSREAGHDGPCAAVPAGGGVREDEALETAKWKLIEIRSQAAAALTAIEAALDRVRAERAEDRYAEVAMPDGSTETRDDLLAERAEGFPSECRAGKCDCAQLGDPVCEGAPFRAERAEGEWWPTMADMPLGPPAYRERVLRDSVAAWERRQAERPEGCSICGRRLHESEDTPGALACSIHGDYGGRAERAKGERIAHECNDPICQAFSRGYRQGRADAAEGGMVRLADVERWLQTDHRRRSTRCRYCGEDELRDICPESDRGIFSCSPTTVPIETHAEAFKREFGEARDDPRG